MKEGFSNAPGPIPPPSPQGRTQLNGIPHCIEIKGAPEEGLYVTKRDIILGLLYGTFLAVWLVAVYLAWKSIFGG